MKLLAIETSSEGCSAALLLDDKLFTRFEIAPMQHTQKILPMIHDLLSESFTSLNQLDAIAFGCGPGSFTGVRIATSVAQGLGFAMELPLIPVSSLAALAQATYTDLNWKKIVTAIDARIQEVYWGAYELNASGIMELKGQEKVGKPQEIELPLGEWSGAGNAWKIYSNEIPVKPSLIDASRLPTAAGVIQIAKVKYTKKDWVRAEDAHPTYLRDEVAKKSHR